MGIKTSNEYFLLKKNLLKQCQSLSEEVLENVKDGWESLSDILERREAVIQQLVGLEDSVEKDAVNSLSQDMKIELDLLIKLINDLDNDAADSIRKEQKDILESLKVNTQEKKLVQYGSIMTPVNGRILDYKK